MSKNEKNPIVFQNERVTVFKNGTWACETCRRKARSRGIRQHGIMEENKICMFEDEFRNPHNFHYSNDPGYKRMQNDRQAPPPPLQPPRRTGDGPDVAEAFRGVSGACSLFGACAGALGGARKHNKTRKINW